MRLTMLDFVALVALLFLVGLIIWLVRSGVMRKPGSVMVGLGVFGLVVCFIWWGTFYSAAIQGARGWTLDSLFGCFLFETGYCTIFKSTGSEKGLFPYQATVAWLCILSIGIGVFKARR